MGGTITYRLGKTTPGSIYVGGISNGEPHGEGVFKVKSGPGEQYDVYKGTWINGEMQKTVKTSSESVDLVQEDDEVRDHQHGAIRSKKGSRRRHGQKERKAKRKLAKTM